MYRPVLHRCCNCCATAAICHVCCWLYGGSLTFALSAGVAYSTTLRRLLCRPRERIAVERLDRFPRSQLELDLDRHRDDLRRVCVLATPRRKPVFGVRLRARCLFFVLPVIQWSLPRSQLQAATLVASSQTVTSTREHVRASGSVTRGNTIEQCQVLYDVVCL